MEPAPQFSAALVRFKKIIGLKSSNFVTLKEGKENIKVNQSLAKKYLGFEVLISRRLRLQLTVGMKN